ncbi:MAG: flagellar hook-basal body complex protein FliE [Acidobacteria bacterium]|nr:flagellar hook-basal body complex protein FliE [Acidobacteriota bacterium]
MITNGISGVLPTGKAITAAADRTQRGSDDPSAGAEFGDSLRRLLSSVETSGTDANEAVLNMADGSGDVHDAMIALQRAEMMLQLTVQMRNKLVQAYQEIMRMPV